ncbi:MAG: hypothetical protein V1809_13225 [Planctomycetota bacterium]
MKFRLRRIIVGVVITPIILVGAVFVSNAATRYRDYQGRVDSKPLDIVVDLSSPGTFTTRICQAGGSYHGMEVFLQMSKGVVNESNGGGLLAGLKVRISVVDESGELWYETSEMNVLPSEIFPDGRMLIAHIQIPSRKANYEIRVVVLEGATALRGVSQKIVMIFRRFERRRRRNESNNPAEVAPS